MTGRQLAEAHAAWVVRASKIWEQQWAEGRRAADFSVKEPCPLCRQTYGSHYRGCCVPVSYSILQEEAFEHLWMTKLPHGRTIAAMARLEDEAMVWEYYITKLKEIDDETVNREPV